MAQSGNTRPAIEAQFADPATLRLTNQAKSLRRAAIRMRNRKRKATTAQTTVDQLNQNIAALRDQLTQIAAALDLSESQEQGPGKRRSPRISASASTRRWLSQVAQLAKYRSEFFGRLRDALGDRPDIRIVGDRFCLPVRSAVPARQSAQLVAIRRQLAPLGRGLGAQGHRGQDPDRHIPGVLAVNGYTDKRPINTPQFPLELGIVRRRARSR